MYNVATQRTFCWVFLPVQDIGSKDWRPWTDLHVQVHLDEKCSAGLWRTFQTCLPEKQHHSRLQYFNISTWEVDVLFKKKKKQANLKIWSGTDSVEQLEGLQQVSDSRVVSHQETVSEHEAQRVFEHQDVLQQDGGGQWRPPVLCRT